MPSKGIEGKTLKNLHHTPLESQEKQLQLDTPAPEDVLCQSRVVVRPVVAPSLNTRDRAHCRYTKPAASASTPGLALSALSKNIVTQNAENLHTPQIFKQKRQLHPQTAHLKMCCASRAWWLGL
jgi:hypothetical protein